MADKRQYAYYIKGNKIALIQIEDTVSTSAGDFNSEYGMYKSPFETIADGLEIQYAYSPTYHIDETDDKNTSLDTYLSLDGLLKVVDAASNNYSTGPESLSEGSYIVLKKAGRWNGLHKVKAAGVGYVTLYTKFSGSASVEVAFEEAPELYYNVTPFNDESFELDISRYQANALVYYLKAKLSEDGGDMEMREFFMREFKRQLEKSTSALKRGPYMVQGFKEMR